MLWPRWLPETMRMPVVAQITGAVALTALIMGPWWSRVPAEAPKTTAPAVAAAPLPVAVPEVPAAVAPAKPAAPARPAHLNLDVRHSFSSVDLSVTVDGKRVLASTLEGSGKKFGIVGRRAERGFTRSLDLAPGVRVVQVRMQSATDKFDQTRTERFELASAAVATLRVTAGRSGLEVLAEHPSAPAPKSAAEPAAPAPQPVTTAAAATTVLPTATASPAAQRADALAELLQSLRSMLIAIAGFVASAATGFVVQEYLRGRRGMFGSGVRSRGERRRRRRTAEATEPEIDAP